ncbi:MAG: hypothetical protein ABR548_10975 [Actinomycetota bacterium]|nr:ABC transporter permease [Actinomycetota bacterium]
MQAFLNTVLVGLVTGSVYALASTGIVLTYKTSGILNFGYGALALFTTFVYWSLTITFHWPVWLAAALVVLIVAPAIGFLLDGTLFRKIQGQPIVIGVIATVGLTVLIQGIVILIWGGQTRGDVPSLFPRAPIRLPGGLHIGVDQAALFGLAVVLALGLSAMFRYARIGVAFRAVVDNRPVAGLMAINTRYVSGLAWAIATAFAAVTGILLTPRLLLDPVLLTPFIIAQVLGAAIVGYLRSLPLAWAGGLFLGVSQALLLKYAGSGSGIGDLRSAMPFLMITVLVLLAPKTLRVAGLGSSFIVKTREVTGHASPQTRAVIGAAFFGLLALGPAIARGSISWRLSLTVGMAYAIVFLSLVILTGYSGQVSLGHTAFMGIAAFTTGHLVADQHLNVWLALVFGALAAVPAGALIGIIAVRVHGLFLALMTLAFAFMAQDMFFKQPSVSGSNGGIPVPRPPGTASTNAFFYLVLAVLLVCCLIAINLRTGPTGRVLAALRDSEMASRSLGINVVKYKVVIFSISALIAGLGGVLASMVTEQATSLSFIPFLSLAYLTVTVVGGVFHVGGALAAGMLWGLYPKLFGHIDIMIRLENIFFGLGATLALARNPEGLFGEFRWIGAQLRSLRDREPRRVAAPLPVAGGQE